MLGLNELASMSMTQLAILIAMFLTQLCSFNEKATNEVPLKSQPPTPESRDITEKVILV